MRSSLHFYIGLMMIAVLALGGCGGSSSQQAQIRLLNVSPGYLSLDLYANTSSDTGADSLKAQGVAYETVSDYISLASDTYTVKLKRNAVTSTLQTLSGQKLTDNSHMAYVAYGSNGHFASVALSEDAGDADDKKTKVHIVNTAEAGALDVYFTDESADLTDATPQFGSVASGSVAADLSIDSGTYRLRVTGAGDTTDMRLDVSNIVLESTKVLGVILTATQGGVLVNAMLLPQQGGLTANHNTKARVRGAVGIANGTAVTASIGGISVLSSAAVGVIGSRYGQVDAGSAAVSLSVDGSPVTVANQTLTAGGDYTLLVWSDANGTETTLVSDDNRVPTTSGKAKIRVLNGMSGLGAPITLAVDFSPVAEGIALGQAAAHTEVNSGTDVELDVSNASTGVNLLSRTPVSLQDAGVYTMFMSGGNGTVGGTLRKDR